MLVKSSRNAACSDRNGPSRKVLMDAGLCGPRPSHSSSSASKVSELLGWSQRLRPTMPELLARPFGILVAGRHQQQLRALDAVGGEDEGLAGDAVRDLVRIVVVGRSRCGPGRHARCGRRRRWAGSWRRPLGGRRPRAPPRVLRVDRADRLAVVGAAAGRPPVIRRGCCAPSCWTPPDSRRCQPLAEAAHGPDFGDRLHRETAWCAASRCWARPTRPS